MNYSKFLNILLQIPGTATNGVSEGSSSTSTSNSTSGVHEDEGELDSDDDEKLDLPEELSPSKNVLRRESNEEQQAHLFYNLKDVSTINSRLAKTSCQF